MDEPTAREKLYRDVLVTVLARLRGLDGRAVSMPELRREAARLADFIRARLDTPGEGE